MAGRWRIAAAGLVLALMAACAPAVEVQPGAAPTTPVTATTSPFTHPSCDAGDPLTETVPTASRCDRISPQTITDGEPITVDLGSGPPFVVGEEPWGDPQAPPFSDPTWQLTFYSLDWLPALVRRARQDGQEEALARLMAVVDRFYTEHPDHGGIVTGWDEGTSLRRLEALSCLYTQAPDPRISAAMEHEARVLLGDRYYGPPHHPVHNHGLLANLRLIEAGTLTDRPDWVAAARTRIHDEAPHAFSALGTSLEQSSTYQVINTNIWADAGRRLAEMDADDPLVHEIRETVARARQVQAWLTEPDGGLVQIGDARTFDGVDPVCPTDPGTFRDDEAGLLAGRWSWDEDDTTFYTLRYGPPRRSHGHHDQGSLTWSTGGVRVLVGTGFFGYDQSEPLVPYGWSPQAANTAVPEGGVPGGPGFVVVDEDASESAHRVDLEGEPYGQRQHRTVLVDDAQGRVEVTDSLADISARLVAHWQLAPGWQVADDAAPGGQTIELVNGPHRLLVRTTGTMEEVRIGAMDPPGGWVFPAPGRREPAAQLVVSGGAELATRFELTTSD